MSARRIIEGGPNRAATGSLFDQYAAIKQSLPPDALLMLRVGDFYEFFGDDAIQASKLLRLQLTKRKDMPMCGVPFHMVDFYANKLAATGRKVAVANEDRQGSLRVLADPAANEDGR